MSCLLSGHYRTVWDMWVDQLKDANAQSLDTGASVADGSERAPGWYSSAHDFWEDEKNCPVTDNGVLGGYAHVSPADIKGSETFFTRMNKLRPGWKRELAVDCGAGIGRVSKFLLLPHFERVDLVEQSPRLLQSVPQYVGRHNSDVARIRNLYCMGLQEFQPEPESYDLIWVQWVSSHLTDADYVDFLKRCKQALRPNGWIGIKENTLLSGSPYELDTDDSSITRYVARSRVALRTYSGSLCLNLCHQVGGVLRQSIQASWAHDPREGAPTALPTGALPSHHVCAGVINSSTRVST